MTVKQIFKKLRRVSIKTVIIVTVIVIMFGSREIEDRRREPLFESIRELKSHIQPEMIINITPDKLYGGGDNYIGNPINDWKLKELAFAMARAQHGSPPHPEIYGSLTIQMNTTGTELYPYVLLYLTEEGLCFTLSIVRNDKSDSFGFSGQDLNEWAKSVGIADTECWVLGVKVGI